MFKRIAFLILGVSLGACSTNQTDVGSKNSSSVNSGRVYTLEERDPSILRDLAKGQSRKPAAESILQEMKIQLLGLQKVSPKKFEIYVFPKDTKQTAKVASEVGTILGKPYKVSVSPLFLAKCSSFKNNGFSKYNPLNYFPAELINSKRSCSIIEFTSLRLTGLPKDLWKVGDVQTKRIYIDDNYSAYGMETDVVQSGRDLTTTKHKLDPREGLSSALDGIPVDLPVFDSLFESDSSKENFSLQNLATPEHLRMAYDSARPLDRMSLSQIKKLNQKFELANCNGRTFAYKDSMRKNVKIYWCQGFAWPQAVETKQYFAVTQNLGGK
jgi:hypothetical protein